MKLGRPGYAQVELASGLPGANAIGIETEWSKTVALQDGWYRHDKPNILTFGLGGDGGMVTADPRHRSVPGPARVVIAHKSNYRVDRESG